jgi:hypothetical protein
MNPDRLAELQRDHRARNGKPQRQQTTLASADKRRPAGNATRPASTFLQRPQGEGSIVVRPFALVCTQDEWQAYDSGRTDRTFGVAQGERLKWAAIADGTILPMLVAGPQFVGGGHFVALVQVSGEVFTRGAMSIGDPCPFRRRITSVCRVDYRRLVRRVDIVKRLWNPISILPLTPAEVVDVTNEIYAAGGPL